MNKRQATIIIGFFMALGLIAWTAASVYAGPGVASSTNLNGGSKWVPTYYANSPAGMRLDPLGGPDIDTGTALRKFIDPLPGICSSPSAPTGSGGGSVTPLANKCMPLAVPDTFTYPGSDYYEIDIVEYAEPMHTDLPATGTKLRGYVQRNVTQPHYLGPLIVASKDRPVRIKYCNLLPSGAGGNLFIPVDKTLMGAGMGPDGMSTYLENRAEIHLHGGDNPWISDGTPHQWTVPAGEGTTGPGGQWDTPFGQGLSGDAGPYLRGVSFQNVPDMPDPGPGCGTLYYPNGDSARLMFYHDHAAGITRLNVYAGEAAGYLLTDSQEAALFGPAGTFPDLGFGIPLVIQEKTFVPRDVKFGNVPAVPVGPFSPAGQIGQDERWDTTHWGQYGDLWFPHVYEPNQDPDSFDGTTPSGRWDWGPWFWPVFPAQFNLPTGVYGDVTTTPEAFGDTPVINGTAYPHTTVNPGPYRFRVLSAANDRSMNLSLFEAEPLTVVVTNPGSGYSASAPPAVVIDPPASGTGATAAAVVDPVTTAIAGITITMGTGRYDTLTPPAVTIDPPAAGVSATAYASVGTEVRMVTAAPHPNCSATAVTNCTCNGVNTPAGCYPPAWPTDGRDGGVPDPATAGPDIIQIGTEGGFLPAPVIIPAQPINYEYFRRSVTVLNVSDHALYLAPAERADIIVDFSAYAGKTLILYNDAPAPVPAFDARLDYYTDNPDQTANGGAPPTWAGYGPNTRTIMQINVCNPAADAGCTAGTPLLPSSLNGPLATAYAAGQPKPVVPELAYNAPWPGLAASNTYAHIYTGAFYLGHYQGLTFTTPETITYRKAPTCTSAAVCSPVVTDTAAAGTTVTAYVEPKAIQELFEPIYGRMNATLGVELPFTTALTQTTIPLGYIDPTTEVIAEGETQFWKITHNGVDTHPVHFHLVNVQVINRVGWDGTVKPPDDNEVGWKETVRMNPLEDIVVAVRAKKPQVPFALPNSNRRMDPTQPVGAAMGFTQVNPATGNPAVVTNALADYGWEYVWHCHILGHEENDFMRPFVFQVAPEIPSNLLAIRTNPATVNLSWTDNSASASQTLVSGSGFLLQRADDGLFTVNLQSFAVPPTASAGVGSTATFADTPAAAAQYFYRIRAVTPDGFSAWSNTAPVISAPILGLAPLPTALVFGNQLVNSTSGILSITLSNSGTAPLTLTSIGRVGANAGDFAIAGSTCPSLLAAGASCVINVTFTAAAVGPRTAGLEIVSNDPANPTLNIPLSGSGIADTVTAIGAPAIGYGQNGIIAVTVTSPQVTPVTGNVTLTVDGVALPVQALVSGSAVFTLTAPSAGSHTLAAAYALQGGFQASAGAGALAVSAAPLTITASSAAMIYGGAVPVITPGFSGFVLGQTNLTGLTTQPACSTTATASGAVSGNPYVSSCSGAAGSNYAITYLPGVVTIGQATSATTLTAHTPGPSIVGQVVTVSFSVAPQFSGTPSGSVTVTASTGQFCTGMLSAGAGSCSMILSSAGSINLTAAYAGDVNFLGSVSAPAAHIVSSVSLSTGTLLFGNQPVGTNSTRQTVTLTNVGTSALTISSITVGGTNAGDFNFTTTCTVGGTLAAGRSCSISPWFRPSAAGVRTATLSISDSDATSPQVITMTGTGVVPVAAVLPSSLSFGTITRGQTSALQAVTVSNTGGAPLRINNISLGGINPNQFTQTNNCPIGGAGLPAGASCTVNVRFRPTIGTTAGLKSAALNVTVAAPATSKSVALTGTAR